MDQKMESLVKRLSADHEQELLGFIREFREGTMPSTYSGMEHHFAVAKAKSDAFLNHKRALGISLGGSNTKIVLACMRGGQLQVEDVQGLANPDSPVHFYDYLDQLLRENPVIDDYLRNDPEPEIGVSIPMMLKDGVPYHPTKLPTIDGFIARNEGEICPELNFTRTFAEYMKSREYAQNYHLFYESDGIVAHHGALSISEAGPLDKTVLCICGTGMANGDELHYLPIAYLTWLPEDDALFPPEKTENRQLNYAVAGKGVFLVMSNAIRERIRMGGSALERTGAEKHFLTAKESRTVIELFQYHEDHAFTTDRIEALKAICNPQAMEELETLAAAIAVRDYRMLANSIFATQISMGAAPEDGKYYVYLEGSIARNPAIKKHVFTELEKLMGSGRYTDFAGKVMKGSIVEDPDLKPYLKGASCTDEMLREMDITAVGAVTMVMAECCR